MPVTPSLIRCACGKVSGITAHTSMQHTPPYAVMSQNIACHDATPRTNPPSVGARIGAAPITSINRDISRAAACPSARSRTIARGITMLADPPNAATNRITDKVQKSGANAHPALASVYTSVPNTSGVRRPYRSASAPCVTCPIASPANQVANVICAVPGRPPNAASISRERRQVHVRRKRSHG